MNVQQERDYVASRPVLLTFLATVAIVVVCVLVTYWKMGHTSAEESSRRPVGAATLPPPPVVHSLPIYVFPRADATACPDPSGVWTRFEWADRERELVHLPIELGIELYLRRHGSPSTNRQPGGSPP